ncbi:hypothetical protein B0H11DRAFT_2214134 [Mycena galericulata]|nr:hypothetical protein B0H11DRAFT_2214134 [Mycena galericulata]
MAIPEQEMASDTRRLVDAALTTGLLQFPAFLSLRRIYWTESVLASRLLRALLPSAPSLEHIYLACPDTPSGTAPLLRLKFDAAIVPRDWGPIDAYFKLLVDPWFPPIRRVVPHGTWHRAVGRGCAVRTLLG